MTVQTFSRGERRLTMKKESTLHNAHTKETGLSKKWVACLAVFASCLLILPLSGCAGLCFTSYADAVAAHKNALRSTLSVPTISQAGTLKVGYMEKAGVPQYEGDENGEPTGLDIDVAAAVADELGLSLELVPVTSAAAITTQSLDMVMGVTEETAEGLTVVSSYLESGVALFSKGDTEIESVQDLVGKTVGYVKGSTTEAIVTASNLQVQQLTFTTLDDAFQGLQDGKVQYVAAPAYPGAALAVDYDDINYVCQLSAPEMVGIGVEPDNTKLIDAVEEALDNISDNGVLNIIDCRWMGIELQLGGEGLAYFTTTATTTGVSGDSSTSTGSPLSGNSRSTTENSGDGSTAGTGALQNL